MKCLRAWAANWELPYSVKSDSVPAFRQTWEEELEMIGARVIHSSTYNQKERKNSRKERNMQRRRGSQTSGHQNQNMEHRRSGDWTENSK